ncbi:proline/serine-rich coiled-coil protein 1 isoform X3 [Dromaius novaehollandiae]|uniref:proline/serine-rich coiled-coil protein 1 isoform X3 n=1 Tax=Dromaius novaehollandiae TaxID=8790 RepID=UPI00311F21F2
MSSAGGNAAIVTQGRENSNWGTPRRRPRPLAERQRGGTGRRAPGTGHRAPGRPWVARRGPLAETAAMTDERDVEFITEERFDFGVLSPSDSREDCLDGEEEEEEGGPAGGPPARDSGRWSPLSGARLEEMVQEANRLAAQLERCRLPRRDPPGSPRSPRSPRRETFVVKNSPVRALLPTVEPGAPTPARPPAKAPARPGAADPPAKAAPSSRKDSPGCRPAPKAPPVARVPPVTRVPPARVPPTRVPPTRVPPSQPCPPRGLGAAGRAKSEPLRAGQAKASGGAVPSPPARATTGATSRVPAPSAIPKPPGRTVAPGAKGPPRASAAAQRGPAAQRAAPAAGCKPGPPGSRLRPPRKTAVTGSSR